MLYAHNLVVLYAWYRVLLMLYLHDLVVVILLELSNALFASVYKVYISLFIKQVIINCLNLDKFIFVQIC